MYKPRNVIITYQKHINNSTIGHKNLQSLNSYKKASLQQQKDMSHVLSSYKKPEINMNQDLRSQSFFAGATITGCTINTGFPTATRTQKFNHNVHCI